MAVVMRNRPPRLLLPLWLLTLSPTPLLLLNKIKEASLERRHRLLLRMHKTQIATAPSPLMTPLLVLSRKSERNVARMPPSADAIKMESSTPRKAPTRSNNLLLDPPLLLRFPTLRLRPLLPPKEEINHLPSVLPSPPRPRPRPRKSLLAPRTRRWMAQKAALRVANKAKI